MTIHDLTLPKRPQLIGVVLADPGVPFVRNPQSNPAALTRAQQDEVEAVQRILGQIADAVTELQTQQRQRLEEMRQVAVELAVAVASRLVHERVEAGNCAAEGLVRQALECLNTPLPVRVFLHPGDLALLEKRLNACRPTWDASKVHLTGDGTLSRGDCRAEVGDTGVRFLVQEQLADIRRHLLETLPEATVDRRRPVPDDRHLRRFPDRRQTA